MKNELCRAFCDDISVRAVPVGLAISTSFKKNDGDALIFYVVDHPALKNMARIEDDGQTIPYLEACGVDFETQTRSKALNALFDESSAKFDQAEMLIHTDYMPREDVPKHAFRFVAMLLRMQDFLLLSHDHVVSTFREDATKLIKQRIGERAEVFEQTPVSANLAEITPDLVIKAVGRPPVAIFFGQTAPRVYDAIILQMAALYEVKEALSVIALLEAENSISREMRQRAQNRLSAVPIFVGDENASIMRIEREAVGTEARLN
jgi:hypothetical protein